MLDLRLRRLKDRTLQPVATVLAPRVPAIVLSMLSLAAGLACAVAAWHGAIVWSLVAWWTSRVADGLDGLVARRRRRQSDLGGFIDLVGDTVVYAAIPLGIAAHADQRATWIAAGVLLATFYVNAVAWLYLSAVLAGRSQRDDRTTASTTTSIVMPSGLIEGTETIVFYTVFLSLPSHAAAAFSTMSALVGVTIVQRALWARRVLR